MKILHINKYHYPKGGADKYYFELSKLFEAHGHRIVHFAMRDEKNLSSPFSKYFVSRVDFSRVRLNREGLMAAGRMLYSFEARRKISELIRDEKPDLAHIHNIYHQISPSILGVLKKHRIPVVMTAEDYALIAPNYSLYHDGAICGHTKRFRYWRAVPHRCVKHSFLASALAALEMSFHKLFRLYEKNTDCIIAPSRFVANILAEYGQDAGKIRVVNHFTDAATLSAGKEVGAYFLYFGRLSQEKGISDVIRAMDVIPDARLEIVGTGPEEARLKKLASDLGLSHRVRFQGFKRGDELWEWVRGARAVVVPSAWYEVFGLVVLEAYALGRPVIASRIGGLAELVEDGVTGFLANPSDPKDLAEKMRRLWNDPDAARTMGERAREKVLWEFNPEKHYQEIMGVYEEVGKKKVKI